MKISEDVYETIRPEWMSWERPGGNTSYANHNRDYESAIHMVQRHEYILTSRKQIKEVLDVLDDPNTEDPLAIVKEYFDFILEDDSKRYITRNPWY